jgi:hypothetical protein
MYRPKIAEALFMLEKVAAPDNFGIGASNRL